jgi:hypothetical protein
LLNTEEKQKNDIKRKTSDNIELHDKKFNVNEISNYQNWPDIEATPSGTATLLRLISIKNESDGRCVHILEPISLK